MAVKYKYLYVDGKAPNQGIGSAGNRKTVSRYLKTMWSKKGKWTYSF